MNHTNLENILDALEGRLSAPDTVALQDHLAECPTCAGTFSELASILDALTQPPLIDASAQAVQRAAALFRPPQKKREPVRELIASLIFDSWREPSAAGFRGRSQTRQVCMQVHGFDLFLHVDYSKSGDTVRGQLQSTDGELSEFGAVLFDRHSREVEAVRSNQFGEFAFSAASAQGSFTLNLGDGRTIRCVLPDEDKS